MSIRPGRSVLRLPSTTAPGVPAAAIATTAQAATASATTALQRALAPVPAATLRDALDQLRSVLSAVDDA
ncbi:hypothetical protein [Streptomyces sp. NPDC048565]|uniref:hypothetical protein n=1 Tax=Streptomyces sp. NPDC048565 TaxID=3155266 RepID=UPI003428741E